MAEDGGQIEVGLGVNLEDFNAGIAFAEQQIGKLERAKIAVKTDNRQLHDLNVVIGSKIDHYGELQRVVSKPVKPIYDGNALSAGINDIKAFRRELAGL